MRLARFRVYGIFVGTIILLVLASQSLIQYQLKKIDSDGKLINDAGRMRMLSQNILQLALRLEDEPEQMSILMDKIQLFKDHHQRVSRAIVEKGLDARDNAIIRAFNYADEIIIDGETIYADGVTDSLLQRFKDREQDYIQAQNKTVFSIAEDNRRSLKGIQKIEIALAIFTIVVIILEIRYIFIPFDKAILESNQQIQSLLKQQDRLMRTVAHDLRNPIGSIRSISEMIEDEVQIEDPDLNELFKMIPYSADQALETISEVLSRAKDPFDQVVNMNNVDLNNLIQKQVVIIENIDKYKNRRVVKVNNEKIEMLLDEIKFSRALQNLIINALKFSEDEITVEHYKEKKTAVVKVIDKGIGMDADQLSTLFEEKKGREGLHDEESYGMGMGIVKDIIEKHNGQLEVDSVPSEGSTFTIRIPIKN